MYTHTYTHIVFSLSLSLSIYIYIYMYYASAIARLTDQGKRERPGPGLRKVYYQKQTKGPYP